MGNNRKHLIIVGVHKGGTTSLYKYLGDHPAVFKPLKKELHFFTPLVYAKTIGLQEQYLENFKGAKEDQYLLDISPSYLYGGRKLIDQIAKLGNVRIIVLLREPTARFISFYKQGIIAGKVHKDINLREFFEASLLEFEHFQKTKEQKDNFFNRSLREGCYSLYLNEWLDHFGEKIRIVYMEDLVKDPTSEMRSLCDWLQIEDIYKAYNFTKENTSFKPRSQWVSSFVNRFFLRYERFFRKHNGLKTMLKSIYGKLNRSQHEAIDAESKNLIADFYTTYNKDIKKILEARNIKPAPWNDGQN